MAVPRIFRRYRELEEGEAAWEGAGVGLRPWPNDPEALLAEVEALGIRRVLLRLHPWASDHRAEEELAAALQEMPWASTFTGVQITALTTAFLTGIGIVLLILAVLGFIKRVHQRVIFRKVYNIFGSFPNSVGNI